MENLAEVTPAECTYSNFFKAENLKTGTNP